MDKLEHLKRIEQEYEDRTGTLYLGDCGLKAIPDEVFDMDWLEELILVQAEQDEDGKYKSATKW